VQQPAPGWGEHGVSGRERPVPQGQHIGRCPVCDGQPGRRGSSQPALTNRQPTSAPPAARTGHPWHTFVGSPMRILLGLAVAAGSAVAADMSVTSPDGKLRICIKAADPPTVEVRFRHDPVIEPSPLSLSLDGTDLTSGAESGAVETYEISAKYPWLGGHAEALNRCRGARITVRHPASGTAYTLDVRGYDAGVAFRFVVPGGDRPRVPDEATTF